MLFPPPKFLLRFGLDAGDTAKAPTLRGYDPGIRRVEVEVGVVVVASLVVARPLPPPPQTWLLAALTLLMVVLVVLDTLQMLGDRFLPTSLPTPAPAPAPPPAPPPAPTLLVPRAPAGAGGGRGGVADADAGNEWKCGADPD